MPVPQTITLESTVTIATNITNVTMAIGSQDRILHRSDHAKFELAKIVTEELFKSRKAKNLTTRKRPQVVIDSNLVGYKDIGSKSPFDPAVAVEVIAKALSEIYIDVIILVDGMVRLPTKRAHWERLGKKATTSINLALARIELSSTLNNKDASNDPVGDSAKVEELTDSIRKMERSQSRVLPSDFASDLKKFAIGE